jgi:hypothetical protein
MSPTHDDGALRFARQRAALARAWKAVYATAEGKRVVQDLLREGGILSVSHVPGDSYSTAFAEGKRAMALHVAERLRWSEGELLRLAEQRTTQQLNEQEGLIP